ncbi:Ig-like domain-containing protein [Paenibacillus sp. DMB20]|nr:Ig-like domain-containing protein [Paenibacillus sp. DMB20]
MGNLYFVTGNELWRHVIEDNKAAVTEVRLNVSTLELSVDQTAEIKAEVQPSFATVKNVSWTSSNSAVASVSAAGVVKGLQPGTAVINVTTLDGSKTAECVVTVK